MKARLKRRFSLESEARKAKGAEEEKQVAHGGW